MPEDLGQKGFGAFRLRSIEEFRRVGGFDDLAVVHEQHAVRDTPGKAHLVGDTDHGHALPRQSGHDVKNLIDHFRVERGSRLVKQHDLGVERQRTRDRDALLLAAGQLRRILGDVAGEPDPRSSIRAFSSDAALDRLSTLIWAIVTLLKTVKCGNSSKLWNTIPTDRRKAAMLVTSGASRKPLTLISPASIVSRPFTVLIRVLLPEPEGPQMTTTSPSAMRAEQFLRTRNDP